MNTLNIRAVLLSGAPYEKDISDGIMSIFDDIEISSNPFRYEISEEKVFEDDDLLELWQKIK
jgi:hypothetical protein